MSHWAELDDENVVIRVTVGDNDDPNGDEGYQWLVDNLGGRWVKTSYNHKIRKNFAAEGYFYDPIRDAFIAPKSECIAHPGETILNEDNCRWECSNLEHKIEIQD